MSRLRPATGPGSRRALEAPGVGGGAFGVGGARWKPWEEEETIFLGDFLHTKGFLRDFKEEGGMFFFFGGICLNKSFFFFVYFFVLFVWSLMLLLMNFEFTFYVVSSCFLGFILKSIVSYRQSPRMKVASLLTEGFFTWIRCGSRRNMLRLLTCKDHDLISDKE